MVKFWCHLSFLAPLTSAMSTKMTGAYSCCVEVVCEAWPGDTFVWAGVTMHTLGTTCTHSVHVYAPQADISSA